MNIEVRFSILYSADNTMTDIKLFCSYVIESEKKSYISRIEKGIVDPGISTFCRIIDALGLKIEIVKPVL